MLKDSHRHRNGRQPAIGAPQRPHDRRRLVDRPRDVIGIVAVRTIPVASIKNANDSRVFLWGKRSEEADEPNFIVDLEGLIMLSVRHSCAFRAIGLCSLRHRHSLPSSPVWKTL